MTAPRRPLPQWPIYKEYSPDELARLAASNALAEGRRCHSHSAWYWTANLAATAACWLVAAGFILGAALLVSVL